MHSAILSDGKLRSIVSGNFSLGADEAAVSLPVGIVGASVLSAEDWTAATAWLVAQGKLEPPELPDPVVPQAVLRHQGLIALLLGAQITEAMIRTKIEEIEAPTERELTRIRFESPQWQRHSEFIAWGAEVFVLSEDQVDDLFVAAAAA